MQEEAAAGWPNPKQVDDKANSQFSSSSAEYEELVVSTKYIDSFFGCSTGDLVKTIKTLFSHSFSSSQHSHAFCFHIVPS
jgi:hypothetical protein